MRRSTGAEGNRCDRPRSAHTEDEALLAFELVAELEAAGALPFESSPDIAHALQAVQSDRQRDDDDAVLAAASAEGLCRAVAETGISIEVGEELRATVTLGLAPGRDGRPPAPPRRCRT